MHRGPVSYIRPWGRSPCRSTSQTVPRFAPVLVGMCPCDRNRHEWRDSMDPIDAIFKCFVSYLLTAPIKTTRFDQFTSKSHLRRAGRRPRQSPCHTCKCRACTGLCLRCSQWCRRGKRRNDSSSFPGRIVSCRFHLRFNHLENVRPVVEYWPWYLLRRQR